MSPDGRLTVLCSSVLPLLVLGFPIGSSAQDLPAGAQVVLIVPEGASRDVVDALQIELQLNGYDPLLSRQSRATLEARTDLFAHTSAGRAVIIDLEGRVVVADRRGTIAETNLGGRLIDQHPRALALVVADLLLRVPSSGEAQAQQAQQETVEPTTSPLVVANALTPPTAIALSRQLGSPPRADSTGPASSGPASSPSSSPSGEAWPPWLRIFTEVGFGFAGSAILGVPAALATDQAAGGWLYGFAVAGPIGFSLGVWLGGMLAGGEGNIWWTLLGGLAGAVVAGGLLLVGVAVDRDTSDGVDPAFTVLGGVAMFALPTTLSILGFELSQP